MSLASHHHTHKYAEIFLSGHVGSAVQEPSISTDDRTLLPTTMILNAPPRLDSSSRSSDQSRERDRAHSQRSENLSSAESSFPHKSHPAITKLPPGLLQCLGKAQIPRARNFKNSKIVDPAMIYDKFVSWDWDSSCSLLHHTPPRSSSYGYHIHTPHSQALLVTLTAKHQQHQPAVLNRYDLALVWSLDKTLCPHGSTESKQRNASTRHDRIHSTVCLGW